MIEIAHIMPFIENPPSEEYSSGKSLSDYFADIVSFIKSFFNKE